MIAPPDSNRSSIDLMSPGVVIHSGASSYGTPSVDLDASGRTGDANAKEDVPEIAQKETRAVQLQRIVVFFVLLVCCALTAGFTYMFTSQGQENDFRTEVRLITPAIYLRCVRWGAIWKRISCYLTPLSILYILFDCIVQQFCVGNDRSDETQFRNGL